MPVSRPKVRVNDCEQPGQVNVTVGETGSVCTLPHAPADAAPLTFLLRSNSPLSTQSKPPHTNI
jgi:hypothetical protein